MLDIAALFKQDLEAEFECDDYDYEYEPTDLELENIEDGFFLDDLSQRKKVVEYMRAYFSDKNMSYGGPIREEELFTEENIDIVEKMDLPHAIELSFIAIGEHNQHYISLILKTLDECCIRSIPKTKAGGILLLFIELCLGYRLP